MTRLVSLFDITHLKGDLSQGKLILTPNQRLASRIRSAYVIASKEEGLRVVDTPRVYSLQQWLDHCWQQLLLAAEPVALEFEELSPLQEQAVWERIVTASDIGSALLRPVETAAQAASAYQNLALWSQDLADPDVRAQFVGDDSATLLHWCDLFDQHCEEQRWLPKAKKSLRILQAFRQKILPQAGEIIGVGFEDIPPLQQMLLDAAGTFKIFNDHAPAAKTSVVACESEKEEYYAAAVWAKQILHNDASATVAIVAPELTQQRERIQRVMQEVFEPEFSEPATARRNLPFNLSAGYPLLEAPVITAAIQVLMLNMPSVDRPLCRGVLNSPFICFEDTDSEASAQLITAVYRERQLSLSSAKFRQLAQKVSEQRGGDVEEWPFFTALQKQSVLARQLSLRDSHYPSEWSDHFKQLLNVFSWPGNRRLDSTEYQQVTHWVEALDSFASLDEMDGCLSFNDALSRLKGILSRQTFQPQTPDSSVQVLGLLEAAGLRFSHLWLMSMSEQQWPAAPSPSPLLPFTLQCELQMPHATAERELEYASQLSERFVHSTGSMVISYPQSINDNPSALSPLFSQYSHQSIHDLLGKPLQSLLPHVEIRRRHHESSTLENYQLGNAPPVKKTEVVTGGTGIFSSQSACPFRAFARHRLNLQALPEAETGLNAADRGAMLHRALELVWSKLKDQQALLILDAESLTKLCTEAAEFSLTEISQRRPVIGPNYRSLELKRLVKLLLAWLDLEKERAEFAIEQLEARHNFYCGELEVETRIDRIDRLADDRLVIIDYKTGISSINRWWGERPDEPQLPLYSTLLENETSEVGGVGFGSVRVDGCSLKGVGDDALTEPAMRWKDKIKSDAGVMDWPQLKRHWQRVLTTLAEDFIAGKVTVDPKNLPATCQYCDFSALCRVDHQEPVL